MTDTRPFPHSSLLVVERHLADVLHSYVRRRVVPRCCLAFVRDDHSIHVPRELVTDPDWKLVFANTSEGLIGRALQTSDVVQWMEGDDTPFRRGDERTLAELGVSIMHQDSPTAVLLIDYFAGEFSGGHPADLMDSAQIYQLRDDIQDALNSQEQIERGLRRQILHLTQLCVSETSSLKGYTAIKRWDGTLDYITAGDEDQRFRRIGQLDGICGEALRTGVFQNAPDVWQHPSYLSSDDRVKSEAVAPLILNGTPIGVLNMESAQAHNYHEDFVALIQSRAGVLTRLADDYRKSITPDIGSYSFLLSDVIEQFSAPPLYNQNHAEDAVIRDWALELLAHQVRRLDGVRGVEFIDRPDEPAGPAPPVSHAAPPDYRVRTDEGGVTSCDFDVRIYGAPKPTMKVVYEARPGRASLEVVSQLCRLTANEVRRRIRERRSAEFENLVGDLRTCEMEDLLLAIPRRLRKIFNCDHVTLFRVDDFGDGAILTPWSTTADRIEFRDGESYYRVAEDDGLTGFAATCEDVLLVRNATDAGELARIHPRLAWKHKSEEDDCSAVRSFFAIPVRCSGRLVALVRGHRSIHFSHLPLSEADRERLRHVQYLLRSALAPLAPHLDETGAAASVSSNQTGALPPRRASAQ